MGSNSAWGNSEAIVALIEKMIRREGIGDLLADGSKAAARKIGKKAEASAIHAGGQDLPMHDGRNDPGYNVHYSVEAAPGRHTVGAQMYYEMFQLWKVAKGLPRVKPLYFKGRKYVADEEKAVTAAAVQQVYEYRQLRRSMPIWRLPGCKEDADIFLVECGDRMEQDA